ncbi:unnamed protein product [Prorocentrum cordatum]|uniref:Hexosyltransferase n=1 Tax=Prorocentrum cordatum TaxID=2364126 RepID=A0ABN9X1P6_9DINO|nr:unnamed protein product [Polarella glacialis]
MVTTIPKEAKLRQVHRETWMSVPGICALTIGVFNEPPGCSAFVAFFAGRDGKTDAHLAKELSVHKDIVILDTLDQWDFSPVPQMRPPSITVTVRGKKKKIRRPPSDRKGFRAGGKWIPSEPLHMETPTFPEEVKNKSLSAFQFAFHRFPWITHYAKNDMDNFPYVAEVLEDLEDLPHSPNGNTSRGTMPTSNPTPWEEGHGVYYGRVLHAGAVLPPLPPRAALHLPPHWGARLPGHDARGGHDDGLPGDEHLRRLPFPAGRPPVGAPGPVSRALARGRGGARDVPLRPGEHGAGVAPRPGLEPLPLQGREEHGQVVPLQAEGVPDRIGLAGGVEQDGEDLVNEDQKSKLISARSNWEHKGVASPAGWKAKAFEDAIDKFYSRYAGQSWKNVISIGDAPHEREALHRVVRWSPFPKSSKCRSKSVKFVLRPSIENLAKEQQMLLDSIEEIVKFDDDLDLHFSAESLADFQAPAAAAS